MMPRLHCVFYAWLAGSAVLSRWANHAVTAKGSARSMHAGRAVQFHFYKVRIRISLAEMQRWPAKDEIASLLWRKRTSSNEQRAFAFGLKTV